MLDARLRDEESESIRKYRIWKKDGKIYIMAVRVTEPDDSLTFTIPKDGTYTEEPSDEPESLPVEFTLEGVPGGRTVTLFDEPSVVPFQMDGQRFSYDFEKCGVHIFVLSDDGGKPRAPTGIQLLKITP